MAQSDYVTGTVSVQNGSTALAGQGTGWLAAGFREGDTLYLDGFAVPLASVEGEGAATLSQPWPGAGRAEVAYRLRYLHDLARANGKLQALIDEVEALDGGAGEPGADGKSAYELAQDEGFEGTLADWLQSLEGAPGAEGPQGPAGADGADGADGTSFSVDASGPFADRGDFDSAPPPFFYLSTDGDGDAISTAVIFAREGASGNWSDPIPFQGPEGPAGPAGAEGPQGPAGDPGPAGDLPDIDSLDEKEELEETDWLLIEDAGGLKKIRLSTLVAFLPAAAPQTPEAMIGDNPDSEGDMSGFLMTGGFGPVPEYFDAE